MKWLDGRWTYEGWGGGALGAWGGGGVDVGEVSQILRSLQLCF